jgi:uncharacterized protein (DUF924 family)
MAHPDEVIEFWFADALESPEAAAARSPFWFSSDDSVDSQIWELYADTVTDAAAGYYEDWLETARGRLALIIVLDQFPRNIFRGTAEVYRYDPLVITLAQAGVALGQLAGMSVPEQAFFLMPYQHSEDLEVQSQGVALMQAMVASAPPEWVEQARGFADFAVRHHDIVESYGRFPHRNKVLGRNSTEAEDHFLSEGGETFGQAD